MTAVTADQLAKLLATPFDHSEVHWKLGSTNTAGTRGEAVPYVDARAVQQKLDDLVGPFNWRNRYTEVHADGRLVLVRCSLALRVEGEWVEKEDAADLKSSDDDGGDAIKGAYSNAMKRVAVQWGIGRYLLRMKKPWVDLVEPTRLPADFDGAAYLAMVELNAEVAAEKFQQQGSAPAAGATAEPRRPAAEPKQAPAPASDSAPAANAPAPAAKPAAAPAAPSSPAAQVAGEALTEKQAELVAGLRKKFVDLGKVPTLSNYLTGQSLATKLPPSVIAMLKQEFDALPATS